MPRALPMALMAAAPNRPVAWPDLTPAGRALLRRFLFDEQHGLLLSPTHPAGGFMRLTAGSGQDAAALGKLKRSGYAQGGQGWMRITAAGRAAAGRGV